MTQTNKIDEAGLAALLAKYKAAVEWHSYRPHDVNREGAQHEAAVKLAEGVAAYLASVSSAPEVRVSVKTMKLADGRADYYVSIAVDDRDVTPHVFRERFKAEYHVALYDWLLNGGEEPDVMAFGPDEWPARKMPALVQSPTALEDAAFNSGLEKAAKLIETHKPDVSFDDSMAGAVERGALLDNITTEVRALKRTTPATKGDGR